ncbi:MAG: TetR/AcrR family transcriptional regulator [Solirubrobacteraceae bacterium]
MNVTARTLSTADERRDTVLAAAQRVFGARGFQATPTTEIAKAAGISHAYLFRLFPTKTELVVAAVRASNERIIETFDHAAAEAQREGADPLRAMGETYSALIEDRELLLMQLHAFAASPAMPEVREAARQCFADLVELIERYSDADPAEIRSFFSHGMLCNVMSAIDPDRSGEHWAQMLQKREHPAD